MTLNANDLIILLALILCGIWVLLAVIGYQKSLNKKEELNDTIFRGTTKKTRKKNSANFESAYRLYIKIPCIKQLTYRVQRRYACIYPGDYKKASSAAGKQITLLIFVNAVVIITVLLLQVSFTTYVAAAVALILFNDGSVTSGVTKMELKLTEEYREFIDEVRQQYMSMGSIENAIEKAIETAKHLARPHAEKLLEIISAPDETEVKSLTQKYVATLSSPYIKDFILACITTFQQGDQKTEFGTSRFLDNVNYISKDLYTSLLAQKKTANSFKFFSFISLFPIFLLTPIRLFALFVIPESISFYYGTSGFLTVVAVLAVSLLVYSIIQRFKGSIKLPILEHPLLDRILEIKVVRRAVNNYYSTHYPKMIQMQSLLRDVGESITVKQFLLKKCILAVVIFAFGLVGFISFHEMSKDITISTTSNIESIVSGATSSDLVQLVQIIPYYADKYKGNAVVNTEGNIISSINDFFSTDTRSAVSTMTGNPFSADRIEGVFNDGRINEETIAQLMRCDKLLKNDTLIVAASKEIVARITAYQGEYFKYWELLLIILAAILAYEYPTIKLKMDKKDLVKKMEDEVIQFHTIIMMLAFVDRMNVDTILMWMNEFAIIFKNSITVCLNNLNSGDEEALDTLVRNEPFKPFTDLVKNLKMSDLIGVMQAFNNIHIIRQEYQDTRAQNNEITLNNNHGVASILIMFPTLASIILYLVVPLTVNLTNSLSSSLGSLSGM